MNRIVRAISIKKSDDADIQPKNEIYKINPTQMRIQQPCCGNSQNRHSSYPNADME
jgi:hypothetical protein